MEILIRKNTIYLDVKVKYGNTTIEIGLLDDKERKELAQILLGAASELLDGLDDA